MADIIARALGAAGATLQGKHVPKPTENDHGKTLVYNEATDAYIWQAVDTSITQAHSSHTATGGEATVPIGVAGFNKETDLLEVYQGNIRIFESQSWNHGDDDKILLNGYTAEAGEVFTFIVTKGVKGGPMVDDRVGDLTQLPTEKKRTIVESLQEVASDLAGTTQKVNTELPALQTAVQQVTDGTALMNAGKLHGKSVPSPAAGDGGKYLAYDQATDQFLYMAPTLTLDSADVAQAVSYEGDIDQLIQTGLYYVTDPTLRSPEQEKGHMLVFAESIEGQHAVNLAQVFYTLSGGAYRRQGVYEPDTAFIGWQPWVEQMDAESDTIKGLLEGAILTNAEKLQGRPVSSPSANDHLKVLQYDHTSELFRYRSLQEALSAKYEEDVNELIKPGLYYVTDPTGVTPEAEAGHMLVIADETEHVDGYNVTQVFFRLSGGSFTRKGYHANATAKNTWTEWEEQLTSRSKSLAHLEATTTKEFHAFIPGALSSGMVVWSWIVPNNMRISDVRFSASFPPGSASIKLDLRNNGDTVYGSDVFSATKGAADGKSGFWYVSVAPPSLPDLSYGDHLTLDITYLSGDIQNLTVLIKGELQ